MKKIFTFLMIVALLFGAGALTSCASDNNGDNNKDGNSQPQDTTATLVGTWRTETNNGYYDLITLNANGTGLWQEVDLENGDDDYITFVWSYDELTRRLILIYADSDTDIYELVSISNNVAMVCFWDDGEPYYLQLSRVK